VKEVLLGDEAFVGDVLWSICELHDLEPYVQGAMRHLGAADVGTAAYALEAVFRGARGGAAAQAGLNQWLGSPVPVREHGIVVLASLGLMRARDLFSMGDWEWAATTIGDVLSRWPASENEMEALIYDPRDDRVLVGLVVGTVGSETSEGPVRIMERSELEWVRALGGRLRRMFGHKW
jgi:hypothetical protein